MEAELKTGTAYRGVRAALLCLCASVPSWAQEVALPQANMAACGVPMYPRSAVRTNATGTTVVAFLIGVDGKVQETKITRSSGHADLDQAALRSVTMCGFKAMLVDGKPAPAWVQSDFTWSLAPAGKGG